MNKPRLTLFEHHAVEAMRARLALAENPDDTLTAKWLHLQELFAAYRKDETHEYR